MSAEPGVYTAFSKLLSENVPSPDVVQVDELAPPPIEPERVSLELSQIESFTPAFTVAIEPTLMSAVNVVSAVPFIACRKVWYWKYTTHEAKIHIVSRT
jgi:hypothetical protein